MGSSADRVDHTVPPTGISSGGRRPRLLTLLPRGPWYRGGTEEFGYSVATSLARFADVRILCSDVDAPVQLPAEPYEFRLLPSFLAAERPIILAPWRLMSEIRWSDALHIHTPFPGIELLAALLGRICGKRVTFTYNMDAIVEASGGGLVARALEFLYDALSLRPALALADAIGSHSLLYVDYSRVLPRFREKVVPIHQGVRSDRVDPVDGAATRARMFGSLGVSGKPVLFAFVGRLVEYKGLRVAIAAFAKAIKQRFDAHFVIGGRGPEREALQELARASGVEDRVHFLGFVDDADLPGLYAAADVVVSPSISPLESTPITLLEAMAQGTAVIGTEVGGTAETVPDGGFNRIVKAGDVDALCDAFVELGTVASTSPKQPRYRRTWDDVAGDYLKLLFR